MDSKKIIALVFLVIFSMIFLPIWLGQEHQKNEEIRKKNKKERNSIIQYYEEQLPALKSKIVSQVFGLPYSFLIENRNYHLNVGLFADTFKLPSVLTNIEDNNFFENFRVLCVNNKIYNLPEDICLASRFTVKIKNKFKTEDETTRYLFADKIFDLLKENNIDFKIDYFVYKQEFIEPTEENKAKFLDSKWNLAGFHLDNGTMIMIDEKEIDIILKTNHVIKIKTLDDKKFEIKKEIDQLKLNNIITIN